MAGFAAWLTIVQRQCLEVRFKWKAVTQFRPVPLQTVREIWKARPINVALDKLLMKNRRIRFDEVRTEGTLLASLLREWAMLSGRCTN
jgi:hypothetical protein